MPAEPPKLVAIATAAVSQGAGLGRLLSPEEGSARIAEYAMPTKVVDWAGPLAGPTELERDFGVARSTLHTWQKQGAVITLLVGVRKHAFPTEQSVDGRPLTGLAAIAERVDRDDGRRGDVTGRTHRRPERTECEYAFHATALSKSQQGKNIRRVFCRPIGLLTLALLFFRPRRRCFPLALPPYQIGRFRSSASASNIRFICRSRLSPPRAGGRC